MFGLPTPLLVIGGCVLLAVFTLLARLLDSTNVIDGRRTEYDDPYDEGRIRSSKPHANGAILHAEDVIRTEWGRQ